MNEKTISQLDANGYFIGAAIAHTSPLEKVVWLIPNGAVDAQPPDIPEGKRAKWKAGVWVFEDIPEPEPEPEPEPGPEQLIARFTAEIQLRLDEFARSRNYDNILSATTYAVSEVPKFRAEGIYAVNARDETWAKAYELLSEYQSAGTVPDLDEVLAKLPVLEWPQ